MKFKIGDKVRVLLSATEEKYKDRKKNPCLGWDSHRMSACIGQVVTVEENGAIYPGACYTSSGYYWYEDDLELVLESDGEDKVPGVHQATISRGKQYRTRSGQLVQILCVDRKHSTHPVVAEIGGEFRTYTSTGRSCDDGRDSIYDLFEYNPLEDLKVDDKILVRDREEDGWIKRYFAGVSRDGKVKTFPNGVTSWSTDGIYTKSWDYWKKAED